MIHILGNQPSLVNTYISELRDVQIQQDSMRFRQNLIRIGEIMAYEISKTLNYAEVEVTTPLGMAKTHQMTNQVVLGTILRAGLPLHQGLHNYFDRAENAIISAFRKPLSDVDFEIEMEYLSSPSVAGKIVILCDPMLATGTSMILGYKAICEHRGIPAHTHIVSVIASEQGLEYARRNLPENTTIWIGAVDPELNAKAYIVPGIGDAGDLAYGSKL